MSVTGKKKIIKKKAIQPENTINEQITTSILENDYRQILASYDPTKNKSRPIISIYEKALLIGKRATQIAYGSNPLVEVGPGMDETAIAEEELRQRKIPLIIKRTIGDYVEYWKPADMILP